MLWYNRYRSWGWGSWSVSGGGRRRVCCTGISRAVGIISSIWLFVIAIVVARACALDFIMAKMAYTSLDTALTGSSYLICLIEWCDAKTWIKKHFTIITGHMWSSAVNTGCSHIKLDDFWMLLITLTMGNFSPFRPSSLLFLIAVGSIVTVGGSFIARFTRFISSVIYV